MGSVDRPLGVMVPMPVLRSKRKKIRKRTVREAAESLVEMALELGNTPDAIHPHHKQVLRTGQHGLGEVPAFQPHTTEPSNDAERHAANSYKSVITSLQRYGGIVPRNAQDTGRVVQDMFGTLRDLMRRESAHREELECLAVETVLRLPEFKTLQRALESGNLKIEASIGRPNLNSVQTQDPGDPDEVEVWGEESEDEEEPSDRITAEYDELIVRRKMTNTLIQGAAVSNNYAYAYYARDELNALDPRMVRDYGKLMAYTELGQYMHGPEIARAASAAHGSDAQGGGVQLQRSDNGSWKIVARGLVFPMLVQEIIKGAMEFLSINDEEDPDTTNRVQLSADFIEDEQYQQMIGPSVWRAFMDAIGHEAAEVMPYVYDELNRMPTSAYNEKMKALVAGTPEGKVWFQQLAQKIKREIEAADSAQGDSAQEEALAVVKHLIQ